MLIQPVQPIFVTLKIGEAQHDSQLISLTDTELELKSHDYLEKGSYVVFLAKYFRGDASIYEISFAQYYFTYKMKIKSIQFQPGLLINTRL